MATDGVATDARSPRLVVVVTAAIDEHRYEETASEGWLLPEARKLPLCWN